MTDFLQDLRRKLDGDSLQVCVTVALVDGRPEPVGLEIWTVHPATLEGVPDGFEKTAEAWTEKWGPPVLDAEPSAIRTKQLRRIPLARWVTESVARARQTAKRLTSAQVIRQPGGFRDRPELQEHAKWTLSVTEPAPEKVPGRPALYDRAHFEKVAEIYTAAQIERRHPTQAVADHWIVGKSTAAKWVSRCRREPLNLLPPTVRGRPAADGTPDATAAEPDNTPTTKEVK